MIRIAHVLCPVDFSEISQHALDHAAAIARWYEARLTLLYVFANLPTMDLPPLVLEDADRERLLSDLRRMAAAVPRDVPVEFRIQEAGFVHEEILAQLGATHADLLVLGTHGRSGFQRLFLGSVTEKVIRKTTCPTLVVPPRAPDVPAGSPIQFRRILCAVDFSESSLDALAYAINVAEEADAQLTLLHVVEFPPVLTEEPTMPAVDLSRVREAAASDARRKLQELIPEAGPHLLHRGHGGRRRSSVSRDTPAGHRAAVGSDRDGRSWTRRTRSAGLRLDDAPRHSRVNVPRPHRPAVVENGHVSRRGGACHGGSLRAWRRIGAGQGGACLRAIDGAAGGARRSTMLRAGQPLAGCVWRWTSASRSACAWRAR